MSRIVIVILIYYRNKLTELVGDNYVNTPSSQTYNLLYDIYINMQSSQSYRSSLKLLSRQYILITQFTPGSWFML
jgi:hypothetical protein